MRRDAKIQRKIMATKKTENEKLINNPRAKMSPMIYEFYTSCVNVLSGVKYKRGEEVAPPKRINSY